MLEIKIESSHEDWQYVEEYCATYQKSIADFFQECIFLHKRRQNQKFEAITLDSHMIDEMKEITIETEENPIETKQKTTDLIEDSEKKGKRNGKKKISNSD